MNDKRSPTAESAEPLDRRRRAGRSGRSLAHEVVEGLQAELQSRAIKPGEKLPTEAELMLRFGVGRGVVREALSQMQAGGLVQTHHGVGTFALETAAAGGLHRWPSLAGTGIEQALQLLELRTSIETDAAGLASSRRSDADLRTMRQALDDFSRHLRSVGDTVEPDLRFHSAIAQATGNPYIGDTVAQLAMAIIPPSRVSAAGLEGGRQVQHLQKVNQEHEDIYAAIARSDPEAARAAMRIHLVNSRERQRAAHRAGLP